MDPRRDPHPDSPPELDEEPDERGDIERIVEHRSDDVEHGDDGGESPLDPD
jgi:hypothetical protein